MKTIATFIIALLALAACNNQSSKNSNISSGPGNGVMCGGAMSTDTAWYSSGQRAPLFEGLGGIHLPVSTKSEEAQKYFDQGLMLSFGFNHAEAARSFYEATRLDSNCAMCWWGYAYVLGPNYNAGMEPDNFKRAFSASQRAMELSSSATSLERDLIAALSFRYSNDTSIARPVLDSAYSAQMRKVYEKNKADATVAALFAESLLDLHPWDLWLKTGEARPWTGEILSVIEWGLKLDEKHPGLNHFNIHAWEASRQAGKAMASADLLRNLVPGSGHLIHMPSHIYIRTGKYHEGTLANLRAVQVDSNYVEQCHAQGAYPLAYYPHNYHFIAATATLEGDRKNALFGAAKVRGLANAEIMKDPGWATLQHYYTIPWFVKVKFAEWDNLLNEPLDTTGLKYPLAVQHYAKGMAYVGKNDLSKAKKELEKLTQLSADSSIQELTIWGINRMSDILEIAKYVLDAEIEAKQKKYAEAVIKLKKAIVVEDQLNYDEPPDWFFSVRHHLGSVQLESGGYNDAIKTYEEDLKVLPENVWALKGLHAAYKGMKESQKAEDIMKRLKEASANSDMPLSL